MQREGGGARRALFTTYKRNNKQRHACSRRRRRRPSTAIITTSKRCKCVGHNLCSRLSSHSTQRWRRRLERVQFSSASSNKQNSHKRHYEPRLQTRRSKLPLRQNAMPSEIFASEKSATTTKEKKKTNTNANRWRTIFCLLFALLLASSLARIALAVSLVVVNLQSIWQPLFVSHRSTFCS